MGNWISAYMEYTKKAESPDNYHIWTALWVLASAVRRHVFLDQGLYVLFPNLYVGLVGPPGRTSKSVAMNLGTRLLKQVPGIVFGPTAVSAQQLVRAMGESKLDNVCALTIQSSELSSLIEVAGGGVTTIKFLTDIFDGNYIPQNDAWKYETKHQGKDALVNPVLNFAFGTTQSYLAEAIPSNVVGHGFTSRIIIVSEETERRMSPRPPPMDDLLGRALVDDLRHISSLYGQFTWGGDVVDYYDKGDDATISVPESDAVFRDEYYRLFTSLPEDHRIEGFHWRKKIHILKVAMLLSMAENDSLELTARDIKAAVAFLDSVGETMPKAFSGVGKYDHAIDIQRIGDAIRKNGGMSQGDVWRKFFWAGREDEVKSMLSTLERMGAITTKSKDGQLWFMPTALESPWD